MESKTTYIEELEKSLASYYKAKASGDTEEIKYRQGFSKGIVHMIRKQRGQVIMIIQSILRYTPNKE